jgi:hypothetical protein
VPSDHLIALCGAALLMVLALGMILARSGRELGGVDEEDR